MKGGEPIAKPSGACGGRKFSIHGFIGCPGYVRSASLKCARFICVTSACSYIMESIPLICPSDHRIVVFFTPQ